MPNNPEKSLKLVKKFSSYEKISTIRIVWVWSGLLHRDGPEECHSLQKKENQIINRDVL